jgi:carbonic anhydrase
MSIMDRFRKRNDTFAKDFDKGDAPMPPAERFVVLTCMYARLHRRRSSAWRSGTRT